MIDIELGNRLTIHDVLDLARDLSVGNTADHIRIHLAQLKYFEIAPMTLVLGAIMGWCAQGKKVQLIGIRECTVFPYMQRMDFFERCGVTLDESFTRNPSSGRFMEIVKVDSVASSVVDKVSTDIADCVVSSEATLVRSCDTQCHQCVEYCVSELVLNAVQHSRSAGYVGCQAYRNRDCIQLGIADHGIGIRGSFRYTQHETESDKEALQLAVQPFVSSRSIPGLPGPNMGVGLAFLSKMAELSGGRFKIVSGNAAFDNSCCCELGSSEGYRGTFAAFEFKRSQLGANFEKYLEESKALSDPQEAALDELEDIFNDHI